MSSREHKPPKRLDRKRKVCVTSKSHERKPLKPDLESQLRVLLTNF